MSGNSQSAPLTVGIDVGTTAVKAVVVDEDGSVVASSRLPSSVRAGPGRLLEHDATATWASAPAQALARACSGAPGVPAAAAVSAMVPSAAAVDADGSPLSPGLLYGDSRGAGQPGQAVDPLANPEMSRFCSWLAASPYGQGASGFWPAQAVANAALAGEGVVDLATAFACGPLFGEPGWVPEVCTQAGIKPSQLPRVAMFGEVVGEVRSPLTGPGRAPIMLAAGSVDGFCEQLVAGAVNDGDVLIGLGSTLLVWLTVPGWPEVRPGLWRVPHFVAGKAMVGGASNAGGLWADWAKSVLAPGPSTSPGGRQGRAFGGRQGLSPVDIPLWWPWARGERVPWHDDNLSVTLSGASISQGPEALLRAAYEASGFVVRYILEAAASSGASPQRYIVSGGGGRNAAWLQAMADVLGQPVLPVSVADGAALGAAYLARTSLGLEPSLEGAQRWCSYRPQVEPDRAWGRATSERYARWCDGLPAAMACPAPAEGPS